MSIENVIYDAVEMPLCLDVCVCARVCDNSRSKQVYENWAGVQSCVLCMHDCAHSEDQNLNFNCNVRTFLEIRNTFDNFKGLFDD